METVQNEIHNMALVHGGRGIPFFQQVCSGDVPGWQMFVKNERDDPQLTTTGNTARRQDRPGHITKSPENPRWK